MITKGQQAILDLYVKGTVSLQFVRETLGFCPHKDPDSEGICDECVVMEVMES